MRDYGRLAGYTAKVLLVLLAKSAKLPSRYDLRVYFRLTLQRRRCNWADWKPALRSVRRQLPAEGHRNAALSTTSRPFAPGVEIKLLIVIATIILIRSERCRREREAIPIYCTSI